MDSGQKSTQTGNAVLVFVAMAMGVLIGLMFSNNGSRIQRQSAEQDKIGETLQLVEESYVDSVDADSLTGLMITSMLNMLDPHSSYLDARETERANEMMRGNFEGVGLVLHREGDTSFIGQVMADGPSAGSGLLPGDLILTVDGDTVSGVGMPADSVVARLRGPRRSTVNICVQRMLPTKNHPLTTQHFTIRRGVVEHRSLPLSTMIDDTTGYIKLTSFSQTSHAEFRQALRQLKADGMRHLIFDLRGNGGGSLSSAIGIAGELLPRGSLIVYTQGAHAARHDIRARSGGLYTTGHVTVLIDENSASASEVVSGALQDNDRATVVGRRSFGKGLVQTEFSLRDGSSLLLTTARYYTPSGRCIQRPYTDGTEEYYRSYVQQLIDEHYTDTTAEDTTRYYTVGHRIVHGGGGITPDIILPYSKDSTNIYYNQLLSAGVINKVAFDYVKHHAAELLQRYGTADQYRRSFTVDEELINNVVSRGQQAGISRNDHSLDTRRRLIANTIKAYIGQSLYGDSTLYRIIMQDDEDLKKIIKP